MERLSRLLPRRRAAQSASVTGPSTEPHLSVLDVGSVSVKALVTSLGGAQRRVLSYAAETLPASADEATLLRAAERALVRAEDDSGVVPKQVAVGVSGAVCIVAQSEKDARRRVLAERGSMPALSLVGEGVYAIAADVELLRRLVTALDLDLLRLVATPAAVASAVGSGLIVDVGGTHTDVALAHRGRLEAVALPIGGAALEERLRDRLGIGEAEARQAVVAHSAGAGHRSSAGLGASRTIGELARHHADVWLDALETGLEEVGRGRALPSTILLCGGGSGLPELRAALEGRSWHAALPFEHEPNVKLLLPRDVAALDLPAHLDAGPEAVAVLCLALSATSG